MAQSTTPRQTADERRVAVVEAANIEFALRGLHGASTDAIARRAGISQPYLFRLYGTKKELFIAVIEDCFARTLDSFRAAAAGMSGEDALHAIGETYATSLEQDRTMLQGQLQSYAASVEDDDIREATARGFGRLVDYVETVSGADRLTISQFFAKGMLMNVLAAMQYSISNETNDAWAVRLAEGCREDEA
ncbi:MAG TPA: TetR/AcrR family transcriptional regulator [Gaiellaceae bacterium]|nr:TetR/AcrR family transcriptional regulator [Gaiellaceae bacterium]